ncbi:MAG: sigma 54-interacting transcriptional regulator [Acidobacteria bacterium]|nr:sigma 54-interacting transcriptional regulator [Acidobacteriota bacterium]
MLKGKSENIGDDDRSNTATMSISAKLQRIQQLLTNCEFIAAATQCEAALTADLSPEDEAELRCLWAEALEHGACFTKAIQVLLPYENKALLSSLPQTSQCRVEYRLGAAYGGTTDIPKAISQTRLALQQAQKYGVQDVEHQCLILMSVLFRKLGELHIAQTYLEPILQPPTGIAPEIIAQAYNNFGIICTLEGKWDEARRALITAIDAVCEKDAPLLRGSLDVNLAAVVSLQGKMREAKVLLERALPQLIRARNPRLIANARSNLGFNLLRLGKIPQAKATLQAALKEAQSCEINLIVASTLETLGECHSIQGDFTKAEELLQQSLEMLTQMRVSFNKAHALRTYGRHLLLQEQFAAAQQAFEESLVVAQQSSDPYAQAEAELYLIEALLAQGEFQTAQSLFLSIKEKIEKLDSLYVLGHLWEVAGYLARHEQDFLECIRRFKQACSIWEVVEEPYRCARMRYHIGLSYEALGNTERAEKYFNLAHQTFQIVAAHPMLERTTQALQQVANQPALATPVPALTTRLVDCLKSLTESLRNADIALPEFTRLLHDDFSVAPIVVFRQEDEQHFVPLAYKGCNARQAHELSSRLVADKKRAEEYISKISLHQNQVCWLYLKRNTSELTDSMLELFVWHLRTILTQISSLSDLSAIASTSKQNELLPMADLIYCSAAMRQIVEQAHRLSQSNINVLITGESGTGKELVAHGIHLLSQRANKPFVPFNCAAAPRELLESQIFGYRRGAFTGANNSFSGVVGAAANGTLFLDEIGDFALEMQPKLLRFIQSGEVQKVGEATPSFVDVRLIAATNCDLEKMVESGRFRADLYYRLNVIRFHLPPLRERREEIALLANHFLRHYSAEMQKEDIMLMPATIIALEQYDWPGNARELESELHRVAALLPSGSRVAPHHLSTNINKLKTPSVNVSAPDLANRTLAQLLDETQRSIISNVLEKTGWNISRAAKELGISRFSLRNMMKRFNLSTN